MCFLITAVVEFLVVVQTGAIDLPEGGSGEADYTHTHTHTNTMSPSKQITT